MHTCGDYGDDDYSNDNYDTGKDEDEDDDSNNDHNDDDNDGDNRPTFIISLTFFFTSLYFRNPPLGIIYVFITDK